MAKRIKLKDDYYIGTESIAHNRKTLKDIIYPIGSLYISVNNTNPSTYFGGTWQSFGAGKTLVGVDSSQTEFNTVKKTGGSKTHTLTVEQMPAHTHKLAMANAGVDRMEEAGYSNGGNKNNNTTVAVKSAGGGKAHNNLQPYITVYFWLRTA